MVCNFANINRDNYKIGLPFSGKFKEIFNSDNVKYGGNGYINPRVKTSKLDECDGREYSMRIKVAALSVSIFSCTELPYEEIVPKKSVVNKKEKTVNSSKKVSKKKNSFKGG